MGLFHLLESRDVLVIHVECALEEGIAVAGEVEAVRSQATLEIEAQSRVVLLDRGQVIHDCLQLAHHHAGKDVWSPAGFFVFVEGLCQAEGGERQGGERVLHGRGRGLHQARVSDLEEDLIGGVHVGPLQQVRCPRNDVVPILQVFVVHLLPLRHPDQRMEETEDPLGQCHVPDGIPSLQISIHHGGRHLPHPPVVEQCDTFAEVPGDHQVPRRHSLHRVLQQRGDLAHCFGVLVQ
mmetsp:Transcript_22706/g.63841  ORF Transcript_22706/g.63841 Transcript_22706/m.63841 type:complete len:236 (+) Transcript_22706:895-1602(+)